jgi:beta-dihydromenaquinone-9 omega-hydroxylase
MLIQDEHGWLAFCPLLRIGKGREMGGSFRATARFIGNLMMSSTSSVLDLIQTRIRTSRRDHEPTAADCTDYHPFLPAVLDDPYPFYRRLLAGGPVHYNQRYNIWIISRYEDVRAALRADDVLSSTNGVVRFRVKLPIISSADRPEHTRLRRLVAEDFSRSVLDRWEPAVNALCDELVGGLVSRGSVDGVAELAVPMPVQVIAGILGIPLADHTRFQRWSNWVVRGSQLQLQARSLVPFAGAFVASVQLRRYFGTQLVLRSDKPGSDLLSKLATSAGRDGYSDDDVFWAAFLLLSAGPVATTSLLAGLLLTFVQHPDQYELLRMRPELIPAAVEEQLRFVSPTQGLYRTALGSYDVDGHTIPAGGRVLLLYAAANRDPRHYPDPDTFRIDRKPTDHLAFGSGIHYCLGAYLSKLQARGVLNQLVRRVRRIELDGPYAWARNPYIRSLTRLPVRLIPG